MYGKFFTEKYMSGFLVQYPFEEMLVEKRTTFQHAAIVRTLDFGRVLFLDHFLNSAESDEFVYHEGIVFPALLRCERRDSVLIIGGAEGGTLREVLRCRDVRRAVMVDIDEELVGLCREFLGDI